MKKIFLIGDSIRYGLATEDTRPLGYGYHVVKKLDGIAQVYQPPENCRFAQYTLRYLHEWAQALAIGENIDIVHWNNGLWDVLRLMDDDPLTSPDQYEAMLPRIHKRIKQLFPNARIIFALTTPVIEELTTPDFYRNNEEIVKYNAIAQKVLLPLGVEIDDLYTAGKEIHPLHHYDWVHYNEEGANLMAEKVIESLQL